jgi:hypothetical protein
MEYNIKDILFYLLFFFVIIRSVYEINTQKWTIRSWFNLSTIAFFLIALFVKIKSSSESFHNDKNKKK